MALDLAAELAVALRSSEGQRALVTALRPMVAEEMQRALEQLREVMSPKLMGRAAIAEMLGLTPQALRNHLYPRKGKLSKLGELLNQLAVVGPDGRQRWRPSDISAHCKPWIGRGLDAGERGSE